MRWWSSNLGHWPLRTYDPSLIVMQLTHLTCPILSSCRHMSRLPSRRLPSWFRMESSAHMGITRLHPRIPKNLFHLFPHPSWPETYSSYPLSSPLRMQYFCCRRSHATSGIYFNMAFRCCYADACLHHGYCNLLHPSYPVSFAHTSNIGRRATHSATVAWLLLIYYQRGLVPSAWSTISSPFFRQVWSPNLCAFIPITCCRKPTCLPQAFAAFLPSAPSFHNQRVAPPEPPHSKTLPG